MKFKLFVLSIAFLLLNCTVEHEEDEFIKRIAGKWELYSITYGEDDTERITWCDETTISEFTYNALDESGDYRGITYFWSDALDSCDKVETFIGNWQWDSSLGDSNGVIYEMNIEMTIKGTKTNINYSNNFNVKFGYELDDLSSELLILTFKNEDEAKIRVYEFKRIS